MLDFIKKHKIFLLFTLFFIFVFLQHQFMFLYHDDYGYASLSYLSDFSIETNGYHTSISQILSFLSFHYNNWGGRVLYFFIECFLLKFGLMPFRLVQSLVITFIFYIIYRSVSEVIKVDKLKLAIMSIACYGIFEIMIIRGGLFWATASVLYLFPLLPFLAFVYFYAIREEEGIFYYSLCAILIFLAAFSQEQISVLALSFIGIYTLVELIKTRRLNSPNLAMCISGLIGFIILMASPGSRLRMNHSGSVDFYNLSFIGKIKRNLPSIIMNNFGGYTRIFTVLFIAVVLYIAYKNIKNKHGHGLLNQLSLLSSSIMLVFTLYKEVGYFDYFYNLSGNHIFKLFSIGIIMIQLLIILYSMIVYFYNKNNMVMIYLIIGAVLSQATMLVAPYFPLRSAIMFEIIMMMVFMYVFCDFYNSLKNKSYIYYLMIPLCLVLTSNVLSITKGYYSNYRVNKDNDIILTQASKNIKSGMNIKKIELKKMKDDLYSCDQPYMENYDYITIYMKRYYNIPKDVEIVYK